MRAQVALAVACLLGAATAGTAVATQDAPLPAVECADDDGRDRLTADGFQHSFTPPAVAAPELGATRQVTGDTVTTWRQATFPLLVDLAPAADALVDVDLGWKRTSDYDLYVLDAEGTVLASSVEENVQTGVPAERVAGLQLRHCEKVTVVVRNWAGLPVEQPMNLGVTVTPGTTLLACVEGDPAAGCAGKPAGAAPDAVADRRTRLYLGGDPGQASMAWAFAGNPDLPTATMSPQRPTGGVPNQYTRPVAGFRDQFRNPFVPHFTGAFDEPRDVVGDVDALVWVSSPTLEDGGTLYVDLYVDDVVVGSVPVAGAAVGTDPTPVHVRFPAVDVPAASSVTLQLGTTPAASTNGPGQPGDAVFTVHYGGVQFPSRITLP